MINAVDIRNSSDFNPARIKVENLNVLWHEEFYYLAAKFNSF